MDPKDTKRVYSSMVVKAVDEEKREITGIASTPGTDRMGDIVVPAGAKFNLPIPLLWQHNHDQPIGQVVSAKVTDGGIEIVARLAKIDAPSQLSARLEEAWQSIKAGLVRGLSIGFKPLKYAFLDEGGIEFSEWDWYELSAVTIPANAEASITSIKSFDDELRASSGIKRGHVVRLDLPAGVSAHKSLKSTKSTPKEGNEMTIQEQIKAFQEKRKAAVQAMNDLMTKSVESGSSLDAEQQEEFDGHEAEIKAIDDHLERLQKFEKIQIEKAVPVEGDAGKTTKGASEVRSGVVITASKSNLPKGTGFTRYAIALARAKGNLMQAAEISKAWADTPEVETVLKAAVAAGTTTDSTWAAPLVEYQNLASEFIELLRPQTIIGRIAGLRNVPFNVKMPSQTSGSTVGWVGEGAPKPVSSLAFGTLELGMAKAAGIVVLTDELVRSSNPSAEALVRTDLINSMTEFLDKQFVDPSVAAVTNVSPASITNGVTPVTASGTTADDLRADVKALFAKFVAAKISLSGAHWIMTPTMAMSIGMMQNALGQAEFPGLGATGGTFMGLPVVASENVPANPGAGDPLEGAGDRIILVKPSEILLADDGGVTLDASREASLQMDSAPTNPPVANTVMVSLWQMNMVGIRAERFINWKRRRADAVGYIDSANYGDAA